MDYQPVNASTQDTGNNTFSVAAILFGIIAIATSCCFPVSIPCGALAIILGLLARGGSMKHSSKSILGVILGAAAFLTTILVTIGSIFTTIQKAGGWDNFMKEYNEYYEEYYEDISDSF